MTLNEALNDAMRSKVFILASKAHDLPGKLKYIRNLHGNIEMRRICK